MGRRPKNYQPPQDAPPAKQAVPPEEPESDIADEEYEPDQPEEEPESPDDYVAMRAGVVGPDGHAFFPGEKIEAFQSWPEHARIILMRDGYVNYRRLYSGPKHVRIATPSPLLVAEPATKAQVEQRAVDDENDLMDQAAFDAVASYPKFDHDMDTGDDGIVVEGSPRPRDTAPAQLRPGETYELDGGKDLQIPETPTLTTSAAQAMDDADDFPQSCVDCGANFPGMATLKQHENTAHSTGRRAFIPDGD